MSAGCKSCPTENGTLNHSQRLALWIALVLNGVMFFAEILAGFSADSVSLKADAIDFLGDTANYAVSLFVLGMSLNARARASHLKAYTMAAFGLWVIFTAIYNSIYASAPEPKTMGTLGLLAMSVNLLVAAILYKFRRGDSNMRSVWLCTRNDVIGNIAVLLAASGVLYTTTRWPDLIVATGMGLLALHSAFEVVKEARKEILHMSLS